MTSLRQLDPNHKILPPLILGRASSAGLYNPSPLALDDLSEEAFDTFARRGGTQSWKDWRPETLAVVLGLVSGDETTREWEGKVVHPNFTQRYWLGSQLVDHLFEYTDTHRQTVADYWEVFAIRHLPSFSLAFSAALSLRHTTALEGGQEEVAAPPVEADRTYRNIQNVFTRILWVLVEQGSPALHRFVRENKGGKAESMLAALLNAFATHCPIISEITTDTRAPHNIRMISRLSTISMFFITLLSLSPTSLPSLHTLLTTSPSTLVLIKRLSTLNVVRPPSSLARQYFKTSAGLLDFLQHATKPGSTPARIAELATGKSRKWDMGVAKASDAEERVKDWGLPWENCGGKRNGGKCARTEAGTAVPASALMQCTRCRLIYYCSKEHQTSDWKIHKKVCVRPPWY